PPTPSTPSLPYTTLFRSRRHHGVEMQALGLLGRERCADDARSIANDEGHLFRRAKRRRDEQVAFVFAVVIVGDDDDLPRAKGGEDRKSTRLNSSHEWISY